MQNGLALLSCRASNHEWFFGFRKELQARERQICEGWQTHPDFLWQASSELQGLGIKVVCECNASQMTPQTGLKATMKTLNPLVCLVCTNRRFIFMCSIHYQRIHPEYWRDRLLRVKALGLNAIQVTPDAEIAPWPAQYLSDFTFQDTVHQWSCMPLFTDLLTTYFKGMDSKSI